MARRAAWRCRDVQDSSEVQRRSEFVKTRCFNIRGSCAVGERAGLSLEHVSQRDECLPLSGRVILLLSCKHVSAANIWCIRAHIYATLCGSPPFGVREGSGATTPEANLVCVSRVFKLFAASGSSDTGSIRQPRRHTCKPWAPNRTHNWSFPTFCHFKKIKSWTKS